MYPLYPIGLEFISFGNPFKKIGIEILYKEISSNDKKHKLERFKNNGWIVYTIEGKYTFETLESLFEIEKDQYSKCLFEELDNEERYSFIEKFKLTNLECLIYYIREELLEDSNDYSEDFSPESVEDIVVDLIIPPNFTSQ